MNKKSVASMRKIGLGIIGKQLASAQTWAAIAAVLVLSATMVPVAGGGQMITAGSALEGSESYTCSSTCYDRYYTCLYSGKSQSYCQGQLSLCLANCGGTARITE